jgi:flagellar basal-body rod protein FlgB
VRILEGLFNPQLDRFQESMGRTTQRQGLLMGNLANVNTPGYRRRDMDFHIKLNDQMRPLQSRLAGARGGTQGAGRVDVDGQVNGNTVNLEQEVMALAETELRYTMLTEMTSRYFAGMKNAIREGK